MDITITLPEDVASELRREAERKGVSLKDYAAEIIQQRLPVAERTESLRSLFAQWAVEDATVDPQEIEARQQDWETLKQGLDANRVSGRKLFSE